MKKQAFLFSAGSYLDSVSYPKPTIDLSGVKYDIDAIEMRLQQIGFSTVKKENACKTEYFSTFAQNTDRCPSDAINIVYFSGHGGHYNGNNYIFPSDFTALFDSTKNIEKSSINLNTIISAFKGKGRLILILDACRDDVGLSKGYFSEMTASENVYIAYGSAFGHSSRGEKNNVSWFTEAICDEILTANIDVDELFTRVRQNIITKHKVQLPSSVNALLEKVSLYTLPEYDDLDQCIYDFIEKYAEEYNRKHGYFEGEELVFIDASQHYNIGLLETYWSYTKVQNKLSFEKGIKMPQVSEAEQKIITFCTFPKNKRFFSYNESHTWYYNGRQIRMGEIPPLPPSMQQKLPELGKEIDLKITASKEANIITISIDLPDGSEIFIGDNTKKFSCKYTVVSKKIIITDAENISRLTINSGIFHENADVKKLLGEKNRNLVGTHIKYNPISGNYIYCYFEF